MYITILLIVHVHVCFALQDHAEMFSKMLSLKTFISRLGPQIKKLYTRLSCVLFLNTLLRFGVPI